MLLALNTMIALWLARGTALLLYYTQAYIWTWYSL